MSDYILAIDQGTTSTRAVIFDQNLNIVSLAQQEFEQHFPKPGWVEHNPEDLFCSSLLTCRIALKKAGLKATDIASIGITNQRETSLLWDHETGQPIHNAIVWQDRRATDLCEDLKAGGHEAIVSERTGLLVDSYFSGTKISWVLKNIDGAREKANTGKLIFGTVETWIIWRLTGGAVHATDATNASRTMIYDIRRGCWDDELLKLLDIPKSILPTVLDSAADLGHTLPEFFDGSIKICGAIGDQQSAAVGQACFQPGMMKSTYGTGCFALLNTGATIVKSKNRLLTTIAYQLDGKPTYALEGSIFMAGAIIQWLRDGLKMIENASDAQGLALEAAENQDVVMVPAFTGLGAPYWDAEARGAIFGMSRGTGPAEIARAALESVGYQTRDLLEAMLKDWKTENNENTILRVDGGMASSDWTMQFLSDILGVSVDRPKVLETTAVGAAYMAGLHADILPSPDEFAKQWSHESRFSPIMRETLRQEKYDRWQDCIARTLSSK